MNEFLEHRDDVIPDEKGDLLAVEFDHQLDYWRDQLADVSPLLELPTDHPRPMTPTFAGNQYHFQLSPELQKAARQFSQEEGATLFMTLLASFQIVLYRYSRQEDIVIGTPATERARNDNEDWVGGEVNILALRTHINSTLTFRVLVQQVRERVLGAYSHQDLPFEYIVKELQLARSLSYHPLFQVMFALQSTERETLSVPSLAVPLLEVHHTTMQCDLLLNVQETNNGFQGQIEYCTDLFEAETIERMMGHWQIVLEDALHHADRSIGTLALLTEQEQQQILVEWNQTRRVYPTDLCIHHLFEEQVVRTPEAIAVRYGEDELTYAQLNQRANQVAHHLRALGIGPETPVGIYMERSLEMIVGVLSVLKAGGAYVPLDPSHPQERLGFMLEDARILILLTQKHLTERLPEHKVHLICLDRGWTAFTRESIENVSNEIVVYNLAYVIYTSGSTGQPKGVCCNHEGVINLLADFERRKPISVGDGCSLWTSMNFDVSVYEMFSALLNGGTLHLVPDTIRSDSIHFFAWLQLHRINSAYIAPHMLADFSRWLDQDTEKLSLRRLLVGVEPIQEQLLLSLVQQIPGLQIINGYGPTEATVCATLYSIGSHAAPARNTPIGRPVQNTEIYLLDANQQPVPIGVPGELYIGGNGLARCYLNRPDLTAERFIPNPFSDELGTRLYKTGDLAHYLPDGNIEYLGRIDHQVKLRGFRIELGEIETILGQHPQVGHSVVVVREDMPGDKRLVAYLMARENVVPTVSELRAHLQTQLPEYMIPAFFEVINELPLTSSGKVDRKQLPAPIYRGRGNAYVAPRTPVEDQLAQIWSNVLGIADIGIHDHFLELGGHSLLAVRVLSRLRGIYRVDIPLHMIFEYPILSEFCNKLENLLLSQQEQNNNAFQSRIPRHSDSTKIFPLSPIQQGLWFLSQLEQNNPFYNISFMLRLKGTIHVDCLQQALQEMIHRHEILHTVFVQHDGYPQQLVAPEFPVTLPVVELQGLTQAEQDQHFIQIAEAEVHQSFDLSQGPLIKVKLLRLHTEDHVLLFTIHHIVFDGWSQYIFLRELSALYTAFHAGLPSPLPPATLHYADYAVWQQQQAAEFDRQLDYWKGQLAGAPALLELPTDSPRPSQQTFAGARYAFEIPASLTQEVRLLSQREQVTVYMTLLAAYQVLLARYSGQKDLVVGSPIAGRTRVELEDMLGFLVNTLALRADVADNPTFVEMIQRVREVALQAYAHQDVPFEQVVQALQPERALSHSPIFQVLFVLQNTAPSALTLPELACEVMPLAGRVAKFDLTMELVEKDDFIKGELEYNTDLFREETIARLVTHYLQLLSEVVRDTVQRVLAIPLLTDQEYHQQLMAWNQTAMPFPENRCIHELFEEQVALTPYAPAVLFEGEQLTYEELNARANQVAHTLQERGVKPDTLVGLCVERSSEMVVGMLGILKAGGTYVPLDPDYPAERLGYMLTNTGAKLLLTQQYVLERLPPHEATVLCLDTDWPQIATAPTTNLLNSGVRPEHLAYVIYTSGSTGLPKGVMVSHFAVVNLLTAFAHIFPLTAEDTFVAVTTITFDIAGLELFLPLSLGARVALASQETTRDSQALARMISQTHGTIMQATPATWKLLLADGWQGNPHLAVLCGGEALPTNLADELKVQVKSLWNVYGPTETTIWSSCCHISSEVKHITIGRPIANTQIYLLDPEMQPVPVGVTGELYLGGMGLARGYLRRPDLTAEKFIPDPFSESLGARLYRTGDLARYRSDGTIEVLGRSDQQVKLRGHRIELGEIEAILSQHPGVQECVAMAREETSGEKRLVAYIVFNPEHVVTTADLRSHLSAQLPAYMLPATFVPLLALPLTSNGKLDRKALPSDIAEDLADSYEAAHTGVEARLVAIWERVLKRAPIGIHDNFFALGGDSIKSIFMITQARQAGLALNSKQIFQYQTIAQLALAAQPIIGEVAENGRITGPTRLMPIQHWFFKQQVADPQHWNQSFTLQLPDAVNLHALRKSIEALLERHDALRTRFTHSDNGWEATILETVSLETLWKTIVVDDPDAYENSQFVTRIVTRFQASLNLEQGHLFKAVAITSPSRGDGYLVLIIHHLVVDAASWKILLADLAFAYEQFVRGETPHFPPRTLSMQQWADVLANKAASSETLQAIPYWQDQAKRMPRSFPFINPMTLERNLERAVVSKRVSLSPEESRTLIEFVPTAYHAHINEISLAALALAFTDWAGAPQILLDLENHGRDLDGYDLTRSVGWCTLLFPILIDLSTVPHTDILAVVRMVKEQVRAATQYGRAYTLLRYLYPNEHIRTQFDAMPEALISFNCFDHFEEVGTSNKRTAFTPIEQSRRPVFGSQARRKYLININCQVIQEQFHIEWFCQPALQERVHHLADGYLAALRQIIAAHPIAHGASFTVTDFPDADLDQKQLNRLLDRFQKPRPRSN